MISLAAAPDGMELWPAVGGAAVPVVLVLAGAAPTEGSTGGGGSRPGAWDGADIVFCYG